VLGEGRGTALENTHSMRGGPMRQGGRVRSKTILLAVVFLKLADFSIPNNKVIDNFAYGLDICTSSSTSNLVTVTEA
jgi:hypothetical protein